MTDTTGTPPIIDGSNVLAFPAKRRKRTARSERKELTMARVLALKVTGRDYIARCIRPGFLVQVTAKGAKSWGIEAMVKGLGKQRRVIFAPIAGGKAMKIDEAQRIAQKLYTDATVHGIDIRKQVEIEDREELTLLQAHEQYINFPGKTFSDTTKRQYAQRLARLTAVLPRGNMWDLTKKQLDTAYVALCKKAQHERPSGATAGTTTAYHAIKYFTTLWNFASRTLKDPRICPARVLKGVMKNAGKRDVYIEEKHFAKWWHSIEAVQIGSGLQPTLPVWALYFRMLVLTGCRRTELLGLKWSEVDLDPKTPQITIPPTRTKTKVEHRFPIGPWLARQLREHKKTQDGTEWVFAYPTGTYCAELPMSTSAATRVLNLQRKLLPVRYNLHDTRRTHATAATNAGVPFLIGAKLLAQVVPGQTAAYAQIKVEHMRAHQNAIEAEMLKLARAK